MRRREVLSEALCHARLTFKPAFAPGVQPFYRQHLSVAFEDDPEAEIRRLNRRARVELERALATHENNNALAPSV